MKIHNLFLVVIFVFWGRNRARARVTDLLCHGNENCTSYQEYGDGTEETESQVSLERAQQWLLSKANPEGGWGVSTAYVVTALALISNRMVMKKNSYGLINYKELELQLALSIARNELNQLALYINALLSVCENPRDFHGFDLISILHNRVYEGSDYSKAFSLLALCNAGITITNYDKKVLKKIIQHCTDSKKKCLLLDTTAISTLTLICANEQDEAKSDMNRIIKKAVKVFKMRQLEDGSFGNVFSSALVLQALNAAETDEHGWNYSLAKQYLLSHQSDDGSLDKYVTAYFVLPALSATSLAHIRHFNCSQVLEEQTITNFIPEVLGNDTEGINILQATSVKNDIYINIVKKIGNEEIDLVVFVKPCTSLFDILNKYVKFKCVFRESSFGPMLISVDGKQQDETQRTYWAIKQRRISHAKKIREENLLTGVEEFHPEEGTIIILEYTTY